jgi:hypothetical protein
MKIFRIFAALFVCLSLLTAGVANASMSCCMMNAPAKEAQAHAEEADMPCHQMAAKTDAQQKQAGKADKAGDECKQCDCMHCIKLSAVMPLDTVLKLQQRAVAEYTEIASTYLRMPEGLLQPPKIIS